MQVSVLPPAQPRAKAVGSSKSRTCQLYSEAAGGGRPGQRSWLRILRHKRPLHSPVLDIQMSTEPLAAARTRPSDWECCAGPAQGGLAADLARPRHCTSAHHTPLKSSQPGEQEPHVQRKLEPKQWKAGQNATHHAALGPASLSSVTLLLKWHCP